MPPLAVGSALKGVAAGDLGDIDEEWHIHVPQLHDVQQRLLLPRMRRSPRCRGVRSATMERGPKCLQPLGASRRSRGRASARRRGFIVATVDRPARQVERPARPGRLYGLFGVCGLWA